MKKKASLCAPEIDSYIRFLDYSFSRPCTEKSKKLLLELFELLRKIVPDYKDIGWHLYLSADRGPISKFADYKEMREEGEVKNRKEFIDYWHEWYPNKTAWYAFYASYDDGWYVVALNNNIIATMGPEEYEKPSGRDFSPLIEWIIEAVGNCIEELKNGNYNARVSKELPYDLRTGTISRNDFWDIYPEEKTDYFKDLSQEEIDEFVEFVKRQDNSTRTPKDRIKTMTAHDFYSWCSLGYKANKYDRLKGFTVKKQYLNHADGRDEGLRNIDEYSPEAFHDWLHNRAERGGHPWEVCRGGNSTHIALYVHEDEKGYFASLAGKSWGRSVETIKFCLALIHNNIPVYLWDAEGLADRVLGKDFIGIVPHYIFPRYCEDHFPDQKILDFTHLPYEKDEEKAFIAKAKWQKIPKVVLVEK